jgi:hypothetical protein
VRVEEEPVADARDLVEQSPRRDEVVQEAGAEGRVEAAVGGEVCLLEVVDDELGVPAAEELLHEPRPLDVLPTPLDPEDSLRSLGGRKLERVPALEGGELEDAPGRAEPLGEGLDPSVARVVELAAVRLAVDLEARAPGSEGGEALRDLRVAGHGLGPAQVSANRVGASSSSTEPEYRKLRSVSDASDAGDEYVTVASTRGSPVEYPPRWKPAVLQKRSEPFGPVNVRTSVAGMRCSSSSSDG